MHNLCDRCFKMNLLGECKQRKLLFKKMGRKKVKSKELNLWDTLTCVTAHKRQGKTYWLLQQNITEYKLCLWKESHTTIKFWLSANILNLMNGLL